jgi:hypothetical protein
MLINCPRFESAGLRAILIAGAWLFSRLGAVVFSRI